MIYEVMWLALHVCAGAIAFWMGVRYEQKSMSRFIDRCIDYKLKTSPPELKKIHDFMLETFRKNYFDSKDKKL